MNFTVSKLLEFSKQYLEPIYSHNWQNIALEIMQDLTNTPKSYFIINKSLVFDKSLQFKDIIIRHALSNEPLAYCLGFVYFLDYKFKIRKPILIPRDDTQYWLQILINKLETYKNNNLKVLDLCSGSGCIGLSLALKFPNFKIVAVDIDPNAIDLIKENQINLGAKNFEVLQSDLFDKIEEQCKFHFDIIISNPPYISEYEYIHLEKSVKDWESKIALVSDNNGLWITELILKNFQKYLNYNNLDSIPDLVLEINQYTLENLKKILKELDINNVEIIQDLNYNPRSLFIWKKNTTTPI